MALLSARDVLGVCDGPAIPIGCNNGACLRGNYLFNPLDWVTTRVARLPRKPVPATAIGIGVTGLFDLMDAAFEVDLTAQEASHIVELPLEALTFEHLAVVISH